jgi:hypothetical protein
MQRNTESLNTEAGSPDGNGEHDHKQFENERRYQLKSFRHMSNVSRQS